ncbi:hypothetical protein Aduo_018538 [Ancylostoma duodenale]
MAVKRVLSWPFFEQMDFVAHHDDLMIRISNVDDVYDGYARVVLENDAIGSLSSNSENCSGEINLKPGHAVLSPLLSRERSKKGKNNDAIEILQDIAKDLKCQDTPDEWDALGTTLTSRLREVAVVNRAKAQEFRV